MDHLTTLLVLGFCMIACGNNHNTQNNKIVNKITTNNVNSIVGVKYITGKFNPKVHEDFSEIPREYCNDSDMYLREEALSSFIKMYNAALDEGIKLVIRSATRNFDRQKVIWENKWTGRTILSDGTDLNNEKDPYVKASRILEYSSMPGTSRHHWGTDIDINSFENEWFESGEGLKIYTWMVNNAHKFGYCQPYTRISPTRPYGYQEEKWHWSFIPLSSQILQEAEDKLSYENINGFLGEEQAQPLKVIENYIGGINKSCKEWH